MGFKLLSKEEARAEHDHVSFQVMLDGDAAKAFKDAVKKADVSHKEAAAQMVRHCLKEAGFLK